MASIFVAGSRGACERGREIEGGKKREAERGGARQRERCCSVGSSVPGVGVDLVDGRLQREVAQLLKVRDLVV